MGNAPGLMHIHPDALWLRGYFYALTNVFGNTGTEVWLNNEGKGKVIGVEREIP